MILPCSFVFSVNQVQEILDLQLVQIPIRHQGMVEEALDVSGGNGPVGQRECPGAGAHAVETVSVSLEEVPREPLADLGQMVRDAAQELVDAGVAWVVVSIVNDLTS